ncbi:MAG: hypothetical protein J2P13_03185 [Acidobacteria bacterium]|nr:hypothetical protein [Acidobacteriota bacterium]
MGIRAAISHRWIKISGAIVIAVFLLWVAFVGFIWQAMNRTPEDFARVMSHMPGEVFLILPFETLWTRARAGRLEIGDPAPDFSLMKLDRSSSLRLSEINRRQPVAMIFGSYT